MKRWKFTPFKNYLDLKLNMLNLGREYRGRNWWVPTQLTRWSLQGKRAALRRKSNPGQHQSSRSCESRPEDSLSLTACSINAAGTAAGGRAPQGLPRVHCLWAEQLGASHQISPTSCFLAPSGTGRILHCSLGYRATGRKATLSASSSSLYTPSLSTTSAYTMSRTAACPTHAGWV